MISEKVEKVTVSERVKMVKYPDESGTLFIVYSAEGYYEDAIYIKLDEKPKSGDDLICFSRDPKLREKKQFPEELTNSCVKAVESVSPFSVTVIKIGSYCNVIPGPRGPIYICIPPGTPC